MPIEQNAANRKAANTAADEVFQLAAAEAEKLPIPAQILFWERLLSAVQSKQPGCGTNLQQAPEIHCPPQADPPSGYHLFDDSVPPEVTEALGLVEAICELAGDAPSWCQDFAEDAAEQARAVGETIERTLRVTPRQRSALENWKAALGRQVYSS